MAELLRLSVLDKKTESVASRLSSVGHRLNTPLNKGIAPIRSKITSYIDFLSEAQLFCSDEERAEILLYKDQYEKRLARLSSLTEAVEELYYEFITLGLNSLFSISDNDKQLIVEAISNHCGNAKRLLDETIDSCSESNLLPILNSLGESLEVIVPLASSSPYSKAALKLQENHLKLSLEVELFHKNREDRSF